MANYFMIWHTGIIFIDTLSRFCYYSVILLMRQMCMNFYSGSDGFRAKTEADVQKNIDESFGKRLN